MLVEEALLAFEYCLEKLKKKICCRFNGILDLPKWNSFSLLEDRLAVHGQNSRKGRASL